MITITVYAGPSNPNDDRDPSIKRHLAREEDVTETLRQIGLEWKTAGYMTSRQVVITLDPIVDEPDAADVQAKVREAAVALEATGLL